MFTRLKPCLANSSRALWRAEEEVALAVEELAQAKIQLMESSVDLTQTRKK